MHVLKDRSLPYGLKSVERPWQKISDQLIEQGLCAEQGHAATRNMIERDSTLRYTVHALHEKISIEGLF